MNFSEASIRGARSNARSLGPSNAREAGGIPQTSTCLVGIGDEIKNMLYNSYLNRV
jgi:hypothetical protein